MSYLAFRISVLYLMRCFWGKEEEDTSVASSAEQVCRKCTGGIPHLALEDVPGGHGMFYLKIRLTHRLTRMTHSGFWIWATWFSIKHKHMIFCKSVKDLKQRIDLITKKCFHFVSSTFLVLLVKEEKLVTSAIGSSLCSLLILAFILLLSSWLMRQEITSLVM